MVIYAKIRRMFYREHLTISDIQRRTSLSRNTIKKWLQEPSGSEPKYQRAMTIGKLAPFEPKLLLALEADSHRLRRDRRTALMLFEAIQKEGFTGGYTIVTDFIRNRRNHAVMVIGKSAFVPLRFEFGDAFQFDWSEEWLVMGGIHRKILAAHTKLCASRAFLLAGYPTQSHEMLFDPDFCNVASGWEKGIVEKNVQDARRRIWIEAKQ